MHLGVIYSGENVCTATLVYIHMKIYQIMTGIQPYTSKNAQAVTGLLQQLVTTSRYQDALPWLATACHNKSVASCQQACCKLIISTGLLQVVSTSCNNALI